MEWFKLNGKPIQVAEKEPERPTCDFCDEHSSAWVQTGEGMFLVGPIHHRMIVEERWRPKESEKKCSARNVTPA